MATSSSGSVRRPTAQDVADLAGVSRSSVSLVLNGRAAGNISAGKQQAVIEAARQLAYRPNALALSLRSQRSWTLGVMSWRGPEGFPQDMLHGAWQIAEAAGYLAIMVDVPDGQDVDGRAASALLDRRVDGLIVIAPALASFAVPEPLLALPTVLINLVDPDHRVTTVVPDELGGAASAVRVLVEHGHTRIALLDDDAETEQAQARRAGAKQAAAAAGVSLQHAHGPGAGMPLGYTLAEQVLAEDRRPTGLVCVRERLALGALLAARAGGLEVPADLSVIALDDGEHLTVGAVPELATVRRPDEAMVELAAALLLAEINAAGETDVRALSFVCPVSLGGSIGPPPAGAAGTR